MTKEDKQADKKMKDRIADFGKETGKETVSFAKRSLWMYFIMTITGFFGGGIGAYIYADSAGHGFWLTTLIVLGGLGGGIVVGFFTAQIVVITLFQELIWDKGYTAAKAGYDEAKKQVVAKKDALKKDTDKKS